MIVESTGVMLPNIRLQNRLTSCSHGNKLKMSCRSRSVSCGGLLSNVGRKSGGAAGFAMPGLGRTISSSPKIDFNAFASGSSSTDVGRSYGNGGGGRRRLSLAFGHCGGRSIDGPG